MSKLFKTKIFLAIEVIILIIFVVSNYFSSSLIGLEPFSPFSAVKGVNVLYFYIPPLCPTGATCAPPAFSISDYYPSVISFTFLIVFIVYLVFFVIYKLIQLFKND